MAECLCCNISPKEQAIYKAVLALLNEGVSINSMKVSDIARKAGIGKGTVYEYFKSKEELIAKALFYGTNEFCRELISRLEQNAGFRDTFMAILNWIDERMEEKNILNQMITLDGVESDMPQEIRKMMKARFSNIEKVREAVAKISRVAIEEGLISEKAPIDLINLMLINNVISYIMYNRFSADLMPLDRDAIRNFLYDSIIKSFRP